MLYLDDYVWNQECRNGERNVRNLGDGGQYFIPGNVAKHSGEYPQTFLGLFSNILGDSVKSVELLGWVAFRIVSNIHDGVLLQK